MSVPKITYTINESAEAIGKGCAFVEILIHSGALKVKLLGGRYAIKVRDLEKYIDSLDDAA